jgi:hypothetical protein
MISELTGRNVFLFLSQAHIEPDLTVGMFLMDRPFPGLEPSNSSSPSRPDRRRALPCARTATSGGLRPEFQCDRVTRRHPRRHGNPDRGLRGRTPSSVPARRPRPAFQSNSHASWERQPCCPPTHADQSWSARSALGSPPTHPEPPPRKCEQDPTSGPSNTLASVVGAFC